MASDYNTHIRPVLGSRLYRSQVRPKANDRGSLHKTDIIFVVALQCSKVSTCQKKNKIGKIFLLHHARSRSHVTGVAQPPPHVKASILGWREVTVSRLASCMALCAAPRCSQSVHYLTAVSVPGSLASRDTEPVPPLPAGPE